MMMTPSLRKLVLTAHVTSSVGLLGAVASFLVLAISGLVSPDVQIARGGYMAMNVIAEFVIVPLAFASLLIGIVSSLGTKWGLVRQYWILAKLLLTVVATIVLLVQMEPIGLLARAAETTLSGADLPLQIRLLIHAGGGLLVLLVPMVLSVYKPWGMTQYGRRKQQRDRALLQP